MSNEPTATLGSELGDYRIEAVLGRGGMGVVYRATDTRLERNVALKLLPAELGADRSFRERFLRESRIAASIDHPGVIPIYEAGDAEGQLYIAMRYVEGTDLAQLLRGEGPLEPERALALTGQLAAALDAAHASGLVHRDIKPSNALVARSGDAEHVYLSDFGLSKQVVGDATLSAPGGLVGTVRYMAPEVIRSGQASASSDLYSLGCVLFECLTGRSPFPASSEAEVIYGHLEREPPRLSDRRPGLPRALDDVLAQALDKSPERRFSSGAELMQAARAAISGAAPARRTRTVGRPRILGRLRTINRSGMLAAVAATAALLVVAAGVLLLGGDEEPGLAAIRANGIAIINPDAAAVDRQVALDGAPSAMTAGADAVWITDEDRNVVSRVDPETHTIRQTIAVGHGPSAIAVERRGVWVANVHDGTLSVISPQTNAVVDTIRIGRTVAGICVGSGSVWAASPLDYSVIRIDANTGRRTGQVRLDVQPGRLACGNGTVWASSASSGTVTEISAAAMAPVRTIQVGRGVSVLALSDSGLWAANPTDATVSRIDPRRGAVTATVALGASDAPRDLIVTRDAVWVSELAGTVARINPERAQVVERLRVGNRPQSLALVDGALWVGVADTGARHRGGTLRLAYAIRPTWRDFDPATAGSSLSAEIIGAVHLGLLTFRTRAGVAEAALVPSLAEAVPPATNRGRTYAFRLRPGLRYSDGTSVRASDVRFSIERAVRQRSGTSEILGALRGVAKCTPRRCDLSAGIVTDDTARTVVFRLSASDRDFLYKVGTSSVLPASVGVAAPAERPLPATGPYAMQAFEPGRSMRLVRNRHFRAGAGTAYADAVEVRFGVSGAKAVEDVLAGRTDRVPGEILPPEKLPALRRRIPAQLQTSVQPLTFYFVLNTRERPFDRLDVRRAVAFAFDRRAAVRAAGGSEVARETCQILPSGFPGHRPYCPFTVGGTGGAAGRPDLTRARGLVRSSGTRGMRVTVLAPDFLPPGISRLMTRTLRQLGYRASLRRLPVDEHFDTLNDTSKHTQIGLFPWIADHPAPSNFLFKFTCKALTRGDPLNANPSQFCDREVDQLMEEAARLEDSDPGTADDLWARAERRIVDAAPAVAAYNVINTELVSERLGNYQYNPFSGLAIDQAWVR